MNITVNSDNSCTVYMQYHLETSEKLQYALITILVDPSIIGKQELEKLMQKPVTITSITAESAIFTISDLINQNGGDFVTPSFEYLPAESLVDKNLQWIVQKFKINFIPQVTTITFPDGYQERFYDSKKIPSLRHQVVSEVQMQ